MEILKEMPKRIPVDGTFELTIRCNLKCKMCLFRHDDSENLDITQKERTAEEWIDMAKQVAEAGTFNLLLTGGEPLLRQDFAEIYEGIYKQGFMITLYTNATLVTEEVMGIFRKFPPHRIGVTIYGASADTYEKVCGNGKAFEKTIVGIEKLMTLPSIIEFRTTIIKDNYHDVDAIEVLVHERFGANYTLTQTRTVNKGVRGACADVESCRLSPEENVKLFLRRGINKMEDIIGKDKFDINKVKFQLEDQEVSKHSKKKQRITLFGCNAGMKSYTISWDGKLMGCQIMEAFYTEPFKNRFHLAWNEYPLKVKIPKLDEKCIQCKNSDLCGSCYASRYAETGNLGGVPEYACKDVEEQLKFL